jgi:hypothetical protein
MDAEQFQQLLIGQMAVVVAHNSSPAVVLAAF